MKNDHTVAAAHLVPINLLGTTLEDTFTAEEAMEKGRLGGWDVRKGPAWTTDPKTGLTIPMEGRNAVIRDNPETGNIDFLGDVGNSHHLMQNEEHADLLNAIVDESGANFEMAGSMENGKKVLLSMKLPGHINVGGVDPVENSLLAINSHDGSMAFTLAILPVRYRCSNIMNCLYGGQTNLIRVRHTSGLKTNLVTKAREALDITFKYLEGFQEQAEQLIQKTMTQAQFEAIIDREFGAEEEASAAAITRADKKIEEMTELFAEAQTQDGIRDTAWAGFNALVEWNDHFAPTRGNDRDVARATKAILDPSFKNRALEIMLAA